MVLRMLVMLLGGTWGLKRRCLQGRPAFGRRICQFLWEFWMSSNSAYIGYSAQFDGIPCFPHGIKGVFISGDAKLGKDCVIFQQATIGSNYLPGSSRMGAPRLGSRCLIGAGAKIIGRIRIGDNCRIGAGCVVIEDLPDNSVVVPAPGWVIQRDDGLSNRYYSRSGDRWRYFEEGKWNVESNPAVAEALEKARQRSCST